MTDIENTESYLTTKVVNKRIQGWSVEEIAVELDVEVVDVVKAWKDYVAGRNEMPREEQWVLHLLRLEDLLKRANDRLANAKEILDFEVVLKILDRIEALQALNMTRKTEADEAMLALTRAQTQLVLMAMTHLQQNFKFAIETAFANGKTIKAIKGELIDNYETIFSTEAQKALTKVSETA